MNRYDHLKNLQSKNQGAYLPFLLLGFPNQDICLTAARALIEEGADGLELGLPFRDPVADGPVIEQAAGEVLDKGFTTDDAIELVANIRKLSDTVPLTLMVYYNMVFARGADKFFADFAAAGIDGILIPDMPPERSEELVPIATKHSVKLIFIAAPTSSEERLKLIARNAGGFVYVVTRLGITGAQSSYSSALPDLFARIKCTIDLPAIAGFGISESAHSQQMMNHGANGVITGSRLVQIIRDGWNGKSFDDMKLRSHTRDMVNTLRN